MKTYYSYRCTHKQNCSVLATANLFGDPCPGTRKYLEAHYKCESAIQTTTAPSRISPPSWQLTSQPSVWSTSTIRTPTTSRTSNVNLPYDENFFNPYRATTQRYNLPSTIDTRPLNTGRTTQSVPKQISSTSTAGPAILPEVADSQVPKESDVSSMAGGGKSKDDAFDHDSVADERNRLPMTTLLPGAGDDDMQHHVSVNHKNGMGTKTYDGPVNENQFCAPVMMRNLFWNVTQAGDINVQPCPGEQLLMICYLFCA